MTANITDADPNIAQSGCIQSIIMKYEVRLEVYCLYTLQISWWSFTTIWFAKISEYIQINDDFENLVWLKINMIQNLLSRKLIRMFAW